MAAGLFGHILCKKEGEVRFESSASADRTKAVSNPICALPPKRAAAFCKAGGFAKRHKSTKGTVITMTDTGRLIYVMHRRPDAMAQMRGSDKYPGFRGTVMFYALRRAVLVRAQITGLPNPRGACESPVFAFHIHDGSSCTGTATDPFAGAGMHYDPKNCPHPYHAGDMPPLPGVGGDAFSVFLTDRFTVPEIIGKAVIIHARPDDFTTQPSGNAGEKIACGIIRAFGR